MSAVALTSVRVFFSATLYSGCETSLCFVSLYLQFALSLFHVGYWHSACFQRLNPPARPFLIQCMLWVHKRLFQWVKLMDSNNFSHIFSHINHDSSSVQPLAVDGRIGSRCTSKLDLIFHVCPTQPLWIQDFNWEFVQHTMLETPSLGCLARTWKEKNSVMNLKKSLGANCSIICVFTDQLSSRGSFHIYVVCYCVCVELYELRVWLLSKFRAHLTHTSTRTFLWVFISLPMSSVQCVSVCVAVITISVFVRSFLLFCSHRAHINSLCQRETLSCNYLLLLTDTNRHTHKCRHRLEPLSASFSPCIFLLVNKWEFVPSSLPHATPSCHGQTVFSISAFQSLCGSVPWKTHTWCCCASPNKQNVMHWSYKKSESDQQFLTKSLAAVFYINQSIKDVVSNVKKSGNTSTAVTR